jgi:tRNA(Ser,Leu) C12 N-acetylase TAN1
MRTIDIIKEIKRLPVSKRIYVVEKTIHSIRTQEDKNVMKKAADELYSDYMTDNELTAFTNLDFVDFYETK